MANPAVQMVSTCDKLSIMLAQIFSNFTSNTLLITGNSRLATWVYEEYHLYQQQYDYKVWPVPRIHPFKEWLFDCWQQAIIKGLLPLHTLLSEAQELALWENIIRNSPFSHGLLKSMATAQMVREAWQTLSDWQILLAQHQEGFKQTLDNHAFLAWSDEFKQVCLEKKWLDTATLAANLIPILPKLALPKHIIALGFDELTPLSQQYFHHCTQAGSHVEFYKPQHSHNKVQQIGLATPLTEIETMACWAQQICRQDPHSLIVGIVPNLNSLRLDLIRTFSEVFKHTDFNIAGGQSLVEYPLIDTALLALSLYRDELPLPTLSTLLLSPFISAAESELTQRAHLDYLLKRIGDTHINPKQYLSLFKHAPKWCQGIQAFYKLTATPATLLPSQWAKLFSQQLIALGWPGERTPNNVEFQLRERWELLLNTFASLDPILNQQSQDYAIACLRNLAQQTVFQAQTERSRIQILGILEANALPITHCWVMGLHDEVWPAAPTPNPFIPLAMQRKLNMPHASAERELDYCKVITQRLKTSAANVIFSYPLRDNDRQLRPSPLIAELTVMTPMDFPVTPLTPMQTLASHPSLEILLDEYGPPLTSDEVPKGGTSIFKEFAACPLRAFAHHRLQAKAVEKPSLGLSAKERGALLHRALELIWQSLKSHRQLSAMVMTARVELIDQAITDTLREFIIKRPSLSNSRLLKLEQQRMQALLLRWLEHESERPDFSVVATEQALTIDIANLPIQVRIDRIDELADGTQIVIDYKTSPTSITKWFGSRLDEPQLPLYASYIKDQTIQGLAYAQLHSQQVKFNGIAANANLLPGVKDITTIVNLERAEDWLGQMQQWQLSLQRIAEQFSLGNAKLDPKEPPKTCQYCDLTIFCRIYETPS